MKLSRSVHSQRADLPIGHRRSSKRRRIRAWLRQPRIYDPGQHRRVDNADANAAEASVASLYSVTRAALPRTVGRLTCAAMSVVNTAEWDRNTADAGNLRGDRLRRGGSLARSTGMEMAHRWQVNPLIAAPSRSAGGCIASTVRHWLRHGGGHRSGVEGRPNKHPQHAQLRVVARVLDLAADPFGLASEKGSSSFPQNALSRRRRADVLSSVQDGVVDFITGDLRSAASGVARLRRAAAELSRRNDRVSSRLHAAACSYLPTRARRCDGLRS